MYVNRIKKHSYILNDLSDFIHNPNEAERPQMAALWNARSN
jgi:hypothetical protein